MSLLTYEFKFAGKTFNTMSYGTNYIQEFCRVIESHCQKAPKYILEWGSGLTTQVLTKYAEAWGSELVLSIDNNIKYQNSIFAGRPTPRFLTLRAVDQIGPTRNQVDPELNYSTLPLSYKCQFDLIFIDGRRRMECAFIAALVCDLDATIILHDYRRARYQPILCLFEVLEDGPQFRVLRPRRDVHQAFLLSSKELKEAMADVAA